jgi:serine/threonine-protein kinase HipA
MIRVWTDNLEAGWLERLQERGSTFSYAQSEPQRAVSVTMPVRVQSWDTPFGLAPIFEMNLPEGALRERLRRAFAKVTGTFDDLDLLGVVGRSLVGRVRYTGASEDLDEAVPFQSVDEILEGRRGGELYRYLIDRFAEYSGISGVQPKVLVRDAAEYGAHQPERQVAERRVAPTIRGATHIIKFWAEDEFPQLAANEFFCLRVAEKCGLTMPRYRLAEDGLALVVDRFDLRPDGTYRGLEDFCVLNAKSTDRKYSGSYESSVMKRFQQFAEAETMADDLEKLFTLIVLNCALRNGDAHLKNFAVMYDDVLGAARLSPVYDVVTTTVYLAQDRMALTLEGSTEWPSARKLLRLGQTRAMCSPARVRGIFERVATAIAEVMPEVKAYRREHSEFAEIGDSLSV